MSLDLNKVPTKFRLDWQANNRIIAGSLFSHILGFRVLGLCFLSLSFLNTRGAREWIENKFKALSQPLGKLADKALASLPGIIGSIISWILNRAKEVIGWLSQNLWALITGVGVLI